MMDPSKAGNVELNVDERIYERLGPLFEQQLRLSESTVERVTEAAGEQVASCKTCLRK